MLVQVSVIALASAVASSSATAQSWEGSVSTDWFTAGNWDTSAVPIDGDVVGISSGTALGPVTIGAETANLSNLNFDAETITLDIVTGGLLHTDRLAVRSGTLNVSGGGDVDASNSFRIGDEDGLAAVATISGAGSTVTTESVSVGFGEEGAETLSTPALLTIESGATVTSDFGFIATLEEEIEGSSAGTVIVRGAGSRWDIDQTLYNAFMAAEEFEAELPGISVISGLLIEDGGVVTSGDANIAGLHGDLGSTDEFDLEEFEFDTFTAEATGTVRVDGAGSRWESSGTVQLASVGLLGAAMQAEVELEESVGLDTSFTATMTIANGGYVSSQDAYLGHIGEFEFSIDAGSDPAAILTWNATATGTALVTGAGSLWENAGDIIVGVLTPWTPNAQLTAELEASGTIQIADQGRIAAGGDVVLARDANTEASLFIGGNRSQAAAAPGVLEAASVQFGDGDGEIVFNHTAADYVFDSAIAGGIAGNGLIETLSGRTILRQDSSAFTGIAEITGGILQVNGVLGGITNVRATGTLEGTGSVGPVANAGIVSPGTGGHSFGTLTVLGNYTGTGGTLFIDTELGDDASPTDMLVVAGNTAGATRVVVTNVGGVGAPTVEGIKVVDVQGASNGTFSLVSDYSFRGRPAVIGGAYSYTLWKNGISNPSDGDWYLRSERDADDRPTYQPGVPVFEAYPQVLLGLNGLPTLQQRVGNRYWSGAGAGTIAQGADAVGEATSEAGSPIVEGSGFWGRIEGFRSSIDPKSSTSQADYDFDIFKMQAGLDGLLRDDDAGVLIGGLTVHYAHASADVSSVFGDGDISTDAYGFGGTLTWYGNSGFYADGQAQLAWYNSDLSSDELGGLTNGNDGFGYALSVEGGKRIDLDDGLSLTPQAQLVYSAVDFDDFNQADEDVQVSLENGDSLIGRLGITLDREKSWQAENGTLSRSHVYGIANLYNEFLDGSVVNVAGVSVDSRGARLWGGLGAGGSYNWNDDKFSLYGEGLVSTSFASFGDSYSLKGTAGFRVKW